MIKDIINIIKTITISLLIGLFIGMFNLYIDSEFIYKFLNDNLITILITLLAINITTIGIVLTKIKEIVKSEKELAFFKNTKKQMLLSIQEQIALIIVSIFVFMIGSSKLYFNHIELVLNVVAISVFVYALFILYDTAKSILIIIDPLD